MKLRNDEIVIYAFKAMEVLMSYEINFSNLIIITSRHVLNSFLLMQIKLIKNIGVG